MKILIFGKTGQVGWELQRSLSPLGEIIALGSDNQNPCGNLADLAGLAQTVRTTAPDIIVNAAAYTAVDKAESEPEQARLINARAPAILAAEAKTLNALLIHYSTDYVFDGGGTTPWQETNPTGPLNTYGQTKLEGDTAIQASGCRHLIFRCSWVYAARGRNFIKTILRLARDKEAFKIVGDQFGAPTSADLIADITAQAIATTRHHPETTGLYHLAAQGETNWCDYARFIVDCARQNNLPIKATSITPQTTKDFAAPAPRPANSRLNTAKLHQTFALTLPPWQSGVTRAVAEIAAGVY